MSHQALVDQTAAKPSRVAPSVKQIFGEGFGVKKFFENFELLSEAEGGIKTLRQLTIELAVKGLLLDGADTSSWRPMVLSEAVEDFQNGFSKRSGTTGRPTPVLRLADIERGSRIREEEHDGKKQPPHRGST